MHRPDRGLEPAEAVVVVEGAGRQHRLLADHAVTTDFLLLAIGVGNHPMTAEQLRGFAADIRNPNEIREPVFAVSRRAAFGKVLGSDLHPNAVSRRVTHSRIIRAWGYGPAVNQDARAPNRPSQRCRPGSTPSSDW